MPDSFPFPQGGQQSYDDRDLDSLLTGHPPLSGSTADIPDALRPVADTLNALRAAPSARELRGEADARAQFRALRQGTPGPAGEPARTQVMPAVPRQRGRHSAGGSSRRPARIRFAGLVAAAAVIVLGVAVTYSGNLPGPVQQLAHDTISAPSPKVASGGSTAGSMQARSARPVSPGRTQPEAGPNSAGSAAPSPGAGRKALCDAFWTDLKHPRHGPAPWDTPRYTQLIAAADGARNVFRYCFPVWDPQYARQYPTLPAYPPFFPRKWNSGRPPGQDQRGDGPGNRNAPAPGGNENGGNDNGNGDAPKNSGTASSSPQSPRASDSTGAEHQQQQGNDGN